MDDNNNKICGGCVLYLSTFLGGECRLTDNQVEYTQPACIDYISDEENDNSTDGGAVRNGRTKRNA